MNKLYPVFFFDVPDSEVFPVNKSAVYLNNYGWVVFLGLIEQVLHCEIAAFKFFRIAVENDPQSDFLLSTDVRGRKPTFLTRSYNKPRTNRPQ
jgi:hypothetical protein